MEGYTPYVQRKRKIRVGSVLRRDHEDNPQRRKGNRFSWTYRDGKRVWLGKRDGKVGAQLPPPREAALQEGKREEDHCSDHDQDDCQHQNTEKDDPVVPEIEGGHGGPAAPIPEMEGGHGGGAAHMAYVDPRAASIEALKVDAKTLADPYYPFSSQEEAELYMWDCSPGKISDNKFNALIMVLRRPGFDVSKLSRSGHHIRRRGEEYIPHASMEIMTVQQVYRAGAKRRDQHAGVGDQPGAMSLKVRQVQVRYISIIDQVVAILLDPTRRRHLQYLTARRQPDAGLPVRAFVDTPFAQEPLLWSDLTSFTHLGVEYRLGDFMAVADCVDSPEAGTVHILRLEELFYKNVPAEENWAAAQWERADELNDLAKPPLWARCTCFTKTGFTRGLRELAERVEAVEVPVARIKHKVTMLRWECREQAPARGFLAEHTYYCKWREVPGTEETDADWFQYEVKTFSLTPWEWAHDNGETSFVWLDFYMDGFVSQTTNQGTTEGVYMRVANCHPDVAASDLLAFTVLLAPHGCDMDECMTQVRRDLALLEAGVVYSDGKGLHRTVVARLSGILADAVAANELCGHMGNNAKRSCRSCWQHATDHMDGKADVRDHSKQRRMKQTKVVQDQMQQEQSARSLTSISKRDAVRTKYGQFQRHSWFRGLSIDPHTQAWRDPEHLIWYGILRTLIKSTFASMPQYLREVAFVWIRDFEWPRGLRSIKGLLHRKFGQGCTMAQWRTAAFVCHIVLESLAAPDFVRLITKILRWAAKMYKGLTPDTLREVQQEARHRRNSTHSHTPHTP